MADPILDEELVLNALKTDVCADACAQLQNAALYSAVSAHDRQCTRPEFTNALDAAMGLYSNMSKLFMLTSIRDNFAAGTLDLEMIDQAISKSCMYAGNANQDLITFMERLIKCPTSQDKVH